MRGHGRLLDALEGAGWRPLPTTDERVAPIFLVGFPRSGTTWLDQALAALPGVFLMEEKTALDEVRAQLGGPAQGAVARLMAFGEARRLELHRNYREIAERHLGAAIEGRRLIDKMPLNLLNFWLIHGIFPDARIVVSLRDPRDVCRSCFTTLFRLRPSTANFPTLEQAARLYREIMGLWLRQRKLMALNARTLRYEDRVGDFEGELRDLLAFLELPWHDAVLNYAGAARQRSTVTPSYDQVGAALSLLDRLLAALRQPPDAAAAGARAFRRGFWLRIGTSSSCQAVEPSRWEPNRPQPPSPSGGEKSPSPLGRGRGPTP